MTYEKIVTLYDTSEHAADARRSLEKAGFPISDISTLTSADLGVTTERLTEPNFWHRLFGRDIQEHEATVYGRVVGSGGTVLTIRVPETDVPRALAILNAHKAVDVRQRAVQEGFIAAAGAPAAAVLRETVTSAKPTAYAAGAGSGEEVLRLAEEQLEVGKRLVREGTTRIRRFVVETPVERQVTLHEEHARVIRRAISDPQSARNVDWTDKVIEVTETIEEPVVSRSTHFTEEVVIQKEATDRVKTVHDKVRHQQVEVDRLTGEETTVKKQN
jgi:stress response protein YsnF